MDDGSAASFYDDLAEEYHLVYADWRAAVRRQAAVLDRLLRAEAGTGDTPLKVLDCACGIGTQALGLAALGHRVSASDISSAVVARARREAESFGVAVSFAVADLRGLDGAPDGPFDAVLACDNALPHLLTDLELARSARAIRGRLRRGGVLLASIRDYDATLAQRPRATLPQVVDGPDGRRIVYQVWDWDDAEPPCYTLSLFVTRDGASGWETRCRRTRYRALRRADLDAILASAGFGGIRWRMPAESGYFQPVVTARAV